MRLNSEHKSFLYCIQNKDSLDPPLEALGFFSLQPWCELHHLVWQTTFYGVNHLFESHPEISGITDQ